MEQIEGLTAEQLNQVPDGYNNNIIWNLAHLICAQQGICYLRGGQAAIVPEKYITPFFTNTRPAGFLDDAEIAEIKRLFISTIDELASDYERKIFGNYTPSPNILNAYGIELNDIDDALDFVLYHEGYHSGYILSLKRLVS